jgi:hypothetical protein
MSLVCVLTGLVEVMVVPIVLGIRKQVFHLEAYYLISTDIGLVGLLLNGTVRM